MNGTEATRWTRHKLTTASRPTTTSSTTPTSAHRLRDHARPTGGGTRRGWSILPWAGDNALWVGTADGSAAEAWTSHATADVRLDFPWTPDPKGTLLMDRCGQEGGRLLLLLDGPHRVATRRSTEMSGEDPSKTIKIKLVPVTKQGTPLSSDDAYNAEVPTGVRVRLQPGPRSTRHSRGRRSWLSDHLDDTGTEFPPHRPGRAPEPRRTPTADGVRHGVAGPQSGLTAEHDPAADDRRVRDRVDRDAEHDEQPVRW